MKGQAPMPEMFAGLPERYQLRGGRDLPKTQMRTEDAIANHIDRLTETRDSLVTAIDALTTAINALRACVTP